MIKDYRTSKFRSIASRFPKLDQFEKKKSQKTVFRVFEHAVSFSSVKQTKKESINNERII